MKVIDSFKLPSERVVSCPKNGFVSNRILLKEDGMGYSLTRTVIPVGLPQFWHYKNHLETCYCVSGMGVLINAETNEEFVIEPGVAYVLDKNDAHFFHALKETTLICVFNPPLNGREVHRKDGSYE